MGTRCEHMAVFYMPLRNPLELPSASGSRVFVFQLSATCASAGEFSMLEFMLCDEDRGRV